MKRVIPSLFVLLLIPSVFSLILLDNTPKDTYNLGDEVDITGYLLQDRDMGGRFQLELSCQEKIPLLIRYITTRRGEQFDIDEKLAIPFSTIGECFILAAFILDNEIIDQTKTNDFTITDELIANFSLENNLIQSGRNIELTGKISKLNKDPFEGLATVYLTLDNENHVVETTQIQNGILDYKYNTLNNVPGDYIINIELNDIYGNKGSFENIAKFTLVTEISVFAETNKQSALPGTTVTLFGAADTILQEKIQEGTVTVYVGDKIYRTEMKRNGQFDIKLDLPEDIKSGQLTIQIAVDDVAGNRGETETSIEIIPIPTSIQIEIPEGSFRPGEEISIKPILYDQANDIIAELVNVEISNTNGKSMYQDSIQSDTPITFTFPKDSIPGSWKITASTSKIKQERSIFVGELQELDFRIENETLIITNIGNVKYTDPIEIKLISLEASSVITKKTSIKPNGELRIDLAREVDPGTYTVEVQDRVFEDVQITSTGLSINTGIMYWTLIIIVILLLLYLAFFRTRLRIIRKIRKKKEIEKKFKPSKPKEEVKDYKTEFKNQMLKQIEERDRKIKDMKFDLKKEKPGNKGFIILGKDKIKEEKQKEERKKGGLFGMFD
ncbi:MAG: hypothetical protein ABIB47_04645 [Candidatus Woesearchaeota archaeon]